MRIQVIKILITNANQVTHIYVMNNDIINMTQIDYN